MNIKKNTKNLVSKSILAKPARRVSRLLRNVWRNEEGVAAIEFAFIAPVMLILYFGLIEISLLVEADRSVTLAASLVGDLAAQNPEVTIDMMENYINAALAIVGTDAEMSEKVGVELTSFEAFDSIDMMGNPSRDVTEIGHAEFGPNYYGGVRYDGNQIDERLLAPGSGIIVARISFQYSSPLQYFVKNPTLKETFFLKPRRSATVEFDSGSPTDKTEMNCSLQGTTTISVQCNPGGVVSTPAG